MSVLGNAKKESVFEKSQSFGRQRWLAFSRLINDGGRSKQVEVAPARRPPAPSQLLMGGNLEIVSIQPADKVTDDTSFDVDARFHASQLTAISEAFCRRSDGNLPHHELEAVMPGVIELLDG